MLCISLLYTCIRCLRACERARAQALTISIGRARHTHTHARARTRAHARTRDRSTPLNRELTYNCRSVQHQQCGRTVRHSLTRRPETGDRETACLWRTRARTQTARDLHSGISASRTNKPNNKKNRPEPIVVTGAGVITCGCVD